MAANRGSQRGFWISADSVERMPKVIPVAGSVVGDVAGVDVETD